MPTLTITRDNMKDEEVELELDLEGVYCPGSPEGLPGFSHGGQPEEPSMYEDITATEVETGTDFTDALTQDEFSEAEKLLLAEG